jgi:hypothetical protein
VLFALSQLLSVLQRGGTRLRGPAEPAGSTEVAEPVQGWRAWRLAVRSCYSGSASCGEGGQGEPFYDAPQTVPGTPRELLRSEPLDTDHVPANARGRLILYGPPQRTENRRSAVRSSSLRRSRRTGLARPSCGRTARLASIGPVRHRCSMNYRAGIPSLPHALEAAECLIARQREGTPLLTAILPATRRATGGKPCTQKHELTVEETSAHVTRRLARIY